MRFFFTFIFIFIFFSTSAAEATHCQSLFGPVNFETLIHELAELRLKLDIAQASNHHTLAFSALKNDFNRKEADLRDYVTKANRMSAAEYKEAFIKEIKNLQNQNIADEKELKEQKRIQEKEIEEAIPGYKGRFNLVSRGEFDTPDHRPVKFDYDFELMTTMTSQRIWNQVAELINKKLGGVRYPVRGLWWKVKSLFVKPQLLPVIWHEDPLSNDFTHPTLKRSGVQIDAWIKGLNVLSKRGDPDLEKILIGHKTGNQYRLPSSEEFEFVLKSRGNDNSFILIEQQLKETAPTRLRNASFSKDKIPLMLDGQSYYDIVGIDEWTIDGDIYSSWKRHYRKGYYSYDGRPWELLRSGTLSIDADDPRIGFRLVREVVQP